MKKTQYHVALSFAGEDRHHAEQLAKLLKSGNYLVFYNQYEQAELWGKDLYIHLSSVYKDQAHYCVMFLSEHYAQKMWTNHELKSAHARAFQENEEYILPVRLDDTKIPGILPTVGYLDLDSMTIERVYQALVEKLSGITSQPATTDIPTWTNLSAENTLNELPEHDNQAEGTMPDNPDPLLALAGTLKYEATDLSEQHDEYIGKALLAEMREDVRPLK